MGLEDWFLTAEERGNATTDLDRRHPDGAAWTTGNMVRPLIHGRTYFRALHDELCSLGAGDRVLFADWRGDAGERLDGPGTELGRTLARLAREGVDVRGLVWRSHPDQQKFSEQENIVLSEVVNGAGGEVLLDERVGAMSLVGLLAILGGSWLSTLGRRAGPGHEPTPGRDGGTGAGVGGRWA